MVYKKKILVTGGAGFIGSNYLNIFVPRYTEYQFINLDVLTYAGSVDNIKVSDYPNYVFIKEDIRDKQGLQSIFKKNTPTDILHFAAESHVDISITNPDIFLESNVIGTHNLLYLAKEYKLSRFHYISTDEVYGSLKTPYAPPFKEADPVSPNNPYSASKASGELLARSYYKTFGLDVVITRSSNNFGPNQDITKLIPKFITHLLAGKKVPLYATGRNMRDWIYVEDNVRGIDIVFHRGVSGEIYNIGGGAELSNKEITRLLLKLTKRDSSYIQLVPDRLGHDFRYALDSSKVKKLGFKTTTPFKDGLERTLEHYQTIE